MPASRMLKKSGPDVELSRVFQQRGAVRHEQLIKLSERYPGHAVIWAELAEEHLKQRRKEEALYACERALKADRAILHRFSPDLRGVCESFLLNSDLEPVAHSSIPEPKKNKTTPAAGNRGQVYGRMESVRQIGQVAVQLAKARALKNPSERRRKLEELTREHSDDGRAWLALAEDHIEARRVEEALAAAQRALSLDSDLQRNVSRKLNNVLRYHKAGIDVSSWQNGKKKPSQRQPAALGPSPRDRGPSSAARKPSHGDASQARPSPSNNPGAGTPRSASAAGAPRPSSTADNARPPSEGGDSAGPSVGKHLALALEVQDRQHRLTALRSLKKMAPNNPAVLFHFAIEAALDGEIADAQAAGAVLRRISPQRYEKLYSVAESYWPSSANSQLPADAGSDDVERALLEDAKTLFLQPSPPKSGSRREPVHMTKVLPPAAQVAPLVPSPRPATPFGQNSAKPFGPGRPDQRTVQPEPFYPASPQQRQPSPPLVAAPPMRLNNPIPFPARPRSTWRTAGALAAGVAAGLLFAVLLVLVLSRIDADNSSSRSTSTPALDIEKSSQYGQSSRVHST